MERTSPLEGPNLHRAYPGPESEKLDGFISLLRHEEPEKAMQDLLLPQLTADELLAATHAVISMCQDASVGQALSRYVFWLRESNQVSKVEPSVLIAVVGLFPETPDLRKLVLQTAHGDGPLLEFSMATTLIAWGHIYEAEDRLGKLGDASDHTTYRILDAAISYRKQHYEVALAKLDGLYPDVPEATILAAWCALAVGARDTQDRFLTLLKTVPRCYERRFEFTIRILRRQGRFFRMLYAFGCYVPWFFRWQKTMPQMISELKTRSQPGPDAAASDGLNSRF